MGAFTSKVGEEARGSGGHCGVSGDFPHSGKRGENLPLCVSCDSGSSVRTGWKKRWSEKKLGMLKGGSRSGNLFSHGVRSSHGPCCAVLGVCLCTHVTFLIPFHILPFLCLILLQVHSLWFMSSSSTARSAESSRQRTSNPIWDNWPSISIMLPPQGKWGPRLLLHHADSRYHNRFEQQTGRPAVFHVLFPNGSR